MERYLKNSNYSILMNKRDLKKLTKGQLIKLLLKQEKKKPKVVDDTKPKRPNRPPPPIPEGVQRIKPTPPPRTGKWENVKPKPIHERVLSRWLKSMKTT